MESTKPTSNEAENGNKSKPLLGGDSEQLLAFAKYLLNHSYVYKGYKPETLVKMFKASNCT